MAATIDLCNFALSHLGVGKLVVNIETEKSAEAAACRLFYQTAMEATLRDFNWPFAGKIVTLALVEENPNAEWAFSYRYPSDAICLRKILSGIRNNSRQTKVPYKVGADLAGDLIFTDKEDAQLDYTILASNPSKYPPDFAIAFSFRLASYIAPRITGGDPFKLGARAAQMYDMEINRAKSSASNEEQAEEEVESEFTRGRNE